MTEDSKNALFQAHVRVRRGPHCGVPPHLIGAIVGCYISAPDHLSALKLAVTELAARGLIFEDLVDGKVIQLDPLQWDSYVRITWPEFIDHFMTQAEIPRFIRDGGVVFSPFAAWERESDT
jgi:hypothetical protein